MELTRTAENIKYLNIPHLVSNLSAIILLSNDRSRFVAASSNEIGRSYSSADIASKFTIS